MIVAFQHTSYTLQKCSISQFLLEWTAKQKDILPSITDMAKRWLWLRRKYFSHRAADCGMIFVSVDENQLHDTLHFNLNNTIVHSLEKDMPSTGAWIWATSTTWASCWGNPAEVGNVARYKTAGALDPYEMEGIALRSWIHSHRWSETAKLCDTNSRVSCRWESVRFSEDIKRECLWFGQNCPEEPRTHRIKQVGVDALLNSPGMHTLSLPVLRSLTCTCGMSPDATMSHEDTFENYVFRNTQDDLPNFILEDNALHFQDAHIWPHICVWTHTLIQTHTHTRLCVHAHFEKF